LWAFQVIGSFLQLQYMWWSSSKTLYMKVSDELPLWAQKLDPPPLLRTQWAEHDARGYFEWNHVPKEYLLKMQH
jgi:hypothetical protein